MMALLKLTIFSLYAQCTVSNKFVSVEQTMNWTAANQYCAATYGTQLATITSDDDAATLLDITKSFNDTLNYFWVGINDITREGEWEWISGHSWSCFHVVCLEMTGFLCISLTLGF